MIPASFSPTHILQTPTRWEGFYPRLQQKMQFRTDMPAGTQYATSPSLPHNYTNQDCLQDILPFGCPSAVQRNSGDVRTHLKVPWHTYHQYCTSTNTGRSMYLPHLQIVRIQVQRANIRLERNTRTRPPISQLLRDTVPTLVTVLASVPFLSRGTVHYYSQRSMESS